MKKAFTFLILALFLTSFVIANPITSYATENEENKDAQGNQISGQTGTENQTQTQARILTQTQIQEIKQERNRIRIQAQGGECPENCTCTGSSIKCALERGGREMIITAGQSGNTIVQVKGTNMSTNVTLYKSEGKVYGTFKNNETKEIRVLPDQVREKIRERLARELEDEEIELDEEGIYRYRAMKRARLFGFIRTRVSVRAEVNSETGELVRIRNSWWGFLARDEGEEIVGAGCGTVSPDSRNECCINKGYDLWNEETLECEFSN